MKQEGKGHTGRSRCLLRTLVGLLRNRLLCFRLLVPGRSGPVLFWKLTLKLTFTVIQGFHSTNQGFSVPGPCTLSSYQLSESINLRESLSLLLRICPKPGQAYMGF
jgi:hypothetical protein